MMHRLAAFVAVALLGGNLLAADSYTPSININFYAPTTSGNNQNTKGGELTTTDAVGLTGYAVPGTSWDNYTLSSSSATFSTVHQTDASGTASEISGASVMVSNAKSNGVWYRDGTTGDFDGTSDVRNGYIDSQGTMSVTISGIPFDYYKIVMYFAPRTDKSFAIGYTTINDELPCYYDTTNGGVRQGKTSWTYDYTKVNATAVTEGVDCFVTPVVKNSSAKTLKISGYDDGKNKADNRASIAAIQIVKVDATDYAEVTVYDPATGEALAALAGAKTVSADSASDEESFGNNADFRQCVGTNIATVVKVTGGTHAGINGLFKQAETATVAVNAYQDTYVVMSGGTATLVKGVQEAHWNESGKSATRQTYGCSIVQLEGDAAVNYVFGAGNKGGAGANNYNATVSGDSGVVVQGNAVVKGSIIGGWSSAHNATAYVTGNTSVLVKNVQSNNTADAVSKQTKSSTVLLGAGWVIGGSAYENNQTSSCTEVGGNSSVTVDLETTATGNFEKAIVGASYLPDNILNNNNSSHNQVVNGSSSVNISAPNDVTFTKMIVGGGYKGRPSTNGAQVSVGGDSSVTLDGGTYTNRIVAGCCANSGSTDTKVYTTGTATLTLKSGVFTSTATLEGGNVGGSGTRVLKATGAIDLSDVAGISDFDSIILSGDDAQLTLPATIDTTAAPWTSVSLSGQTEQEGSGEWNVKWRTNANGTKTVYARFVKPGLIIKIAAADVLLDEDAGLTNWLASANVDWNIDAAATNDLATVNSKGISPLAAYLLGYTEYSSTTDAPALTASVLGDSFTLAYDLTGKTTPLPTISGIGLSYAIESSSDPAFASSVTTTDGTTLAFASAGLYNKLVANIVAN